MFVSWKKIENARSTAACCSSESAPMVSSSSARSPVSRASRARPRICSSRHEQLLALLLDEDVPEHVAEQADVGAEGRVW